MPRKVLLCRPRAGFNDMLNQIEICWQYAKLHDMEMIVDSRKRSFYDSFDMYFEVLEPTADVSFKLTALREKQLNLLSTYPPEQQGEVDLISSKRGIRPNTCRKTRIDVNNIYEEELVIHEAGGGGERGLKCLSRLRFSPSVSREIQSNMSVLRPGYMAIHVRNTDIKTDYKNYFEKLREKAKGRQLLVCSDDAACISYAKEFFYESEVVVVSRTPPTTGTNIHNNAELRNRFGSRALNVAMLTDLISLACSSDLYIGTPNNERSSGFSSLVRDLNSNKHIVQTLLGEQRKLGVLEKIGLGVLRNIGIVLSLDRRTIN